MEETNEDLLEKIAELENKLLEAEETIEAIKYDKVDALVVSTSDGERIYTLSSADRPYRIFLEQMNEGAVTLSSQGIILFCNKSFSQMLKRPLENLVGSPLDNWVLPAESQSLKEFLRQDIESIKEEINFVKSDGSCISLYISLTKLNLDNTEPVSCIVATDLTEKKRSEEIVAAEKLARSILEQAGEAILVCDENFKITRASSAAEVLAGEPVLYKHFDLVFPLSDSLKNPVSMRDIISHLNGAQVDATLHTNSFKKYSLILNVGVLKGSLSSPIGYVINLTNISRHIEAEEKLSQSLKEKTILLKEIHHRVKNNLQIISSLLRLQAIYSGEDHITDILNECQNRINSMALIHQKLYESKSFAHIDMGAYLKELVIFLCNTYMINSDRIRIKHPKEEITFSIDIAVPLGLIINELITNSFKHAFNERNKGQVTVSIAIQDANVVVISIKDNGSGFPENLNFYKPGSLGLQLVHSLAEQINGTIKLNSVKGTEIIISLPRNDQA